MNRRLALTIALGLLGGARAAMAQDVAIGYQGLPYKVSSASAADNSTGINLAEGMLLHVGAGAEAGWDSNVFYASSSSPQGVTSSGLLRFTGFGELSNATRQGAAPSGLVYDVRAGLTYRRYTSDDNGVGLYRNAFMPSAGLSLGGNSGSMGFQLADAFIRLEDPPYQAALTSGPIARDSNIASAQLQWSPGGGRISSTFRYSNIIDIFEQSSGYSYASNLTNQLLVDVSWKWLPKTALFLQATQGWVTYLNGGTPKDSSFPLHVLAGLRGLITPKTTALASLGYANGFYSSGATTSGILGSTYVELQLTITPTMLSRVIVGYHQDFTNAVISAFYYDNAAYASYVQQIAGRLAFDLSGRVSHRRYQGLLFDPRPDATRTDNIVIVGASLDYFVRNWAYVGVGYAFTADITDYTLPGSNTPADYNKQQVFARLGLTY